MVLVVTHDPRLTPFADRVFELADGQLQADGPPESGLPRAYEHAPLPESDLRLRLYDPVA